ncbi:MAG TPA: UvrD-helicase domain-containing protein, partial [Cyclobacteriaceae bacterium]|nr:UvrD-helicase domain-containing protein [Cyclobacteriaceae bacterium]
MNFRIADSFLDSLARLTGDEQKAVKTTAFDLQMNAANPGMQFHRLDKARDKNFWSVRVSSNIRIIVHKSQGSLLLCYVNHHDKAYDWAERRRLEAHPTTGAAQIVEIRETIKEIVVPVYVHESVVPKPRKKLFANTTEAELLSYGVPAEWIGDVRNADEDTLFAIAEHLPAEAAEALLILATEGIPGADHYEYVKPKDPFTHPDALRRFRIFKNVDELQRALDSSWDRWAVFLHPDQDEFVKADYSGPARVTGSAGTGKTIVALHRAVNLARSNPNSRILLTTFSPILANALKVKLRRLVSNEPSLSERVDIHPINDIGRRLYKSNIGTANIVSDEHLLAMISKGYLEGKKHKFTISFLVSEWQEVVDAWQVSSWDEYRDVRRMGRKTRLPEAQRLVLWKVFEKVNETLRKDGLLTHSGLFSVLAKHMTVSGRRPYDHIIVDESQDIAVWHLRFLA